MSRLSALSLAHPITAGDYILVVSGFDNSSGPYELLFTNAFPLVGAYYEKDIEIMTPPLVQSASRIASSGMASILYQAHLARLQSAGTYSTHSPESMTTPSGIIAGRFHAYASFSHHHSFGGGALDSTGQGGQVGIDYAISERLALGFTAGGARLSSESATTRVEGSAVWVQPYLSYLSEMEGGSLHVLAALQIQSLGLDLRSGPVTGSTDGLGLVGRIEVAYRRALGEGYAVSPYARFSAGNTGFSDYTLGLVGANPVSSRLIELDGGVELSADLAAAFGFGGQAYVRAEIQYRDSNTPASSASVANVDYDGFGAGVAAGLTFDISDAFSLSLEGSADAIGTDLSTYGLTARFGSVF